MQPDLRCYHHPDREATAQCDRCGDYLCDECEREWNDERLCRECLQDRIPAKVGSDGEVACILNFVSMFLACFCAAGLVLNIVALIEALRDKGKGAVGSRGRLMLQSMAIYAGCQVGVGFVLVPLMLLTSIQGPALGAPIVIVATMMACSLAGSMLAVVTWWQALAGAFEPSWVKVLTIIPPILGTLGGIIQITFFVLEGAPMGF